MPPVSSENVESSATERAVEFAPVGDIPFPRIDLAILHDPIPAILAAPEFTDTRRFFSGTLWNSRALQTSTALALHYSLVRNLRPDHVVEIGTYRGGTAEILSRALDANQHGTLHTVSPFETEGFGPIFAQWPEQLRQRTKYYPIDSMAFFMKAAAENIHTGIVFVDGNHDYEFASFDIWSAARRMVPGGFIFIDNVAQFGPYRAAMDFLATNPGWRACGRWPADLDETRAFAPGRTWILETDSLVLRAPFHHVVGRRPSTLGQIGWHSMEVAGLTVQPAMQGQQGLLKAQCIVRAFSPQRIMEVMTEAESFLKGDREPVQLRFARSWASETGFNSYTVEPWLCWMGDEPLELAALPTLS